MSKIIARRGQFQVRTDGFDIMLEKRTTEDSGNSWLSVLEYYEWPHEAIAAMNWSYDHEVRCRLAECQEDF